jgi:hypothetical protein
MKNVYSRIEISDTGISAQNSKPQQFEKGIYKMAANKYD